MRMEGIEPSSSARKDDCLPLAYIRFLEQVHDRRSTLACSYEPERNRTFNRLRIRQVHYHCATGSMDATGIEPVSFRL